MDNVLPQLLSFPPHPPPADPLPDAEYDKQIRIIVEKLNSTPGSKLTGGVRGGGDLLEILDPSINTLPYLFVLLAHISTSGGKQKSDAQSLSQSFTPNEPLWQRMMEFMERFDPVQIRYAGNEMRRLIELTFQRADQLHQPAIAISPIRTAILRIDPSGATLTSSHLTLSAVCLQARAFASALPVLDKDISFLPTSSEKQAEAASNLVSPYLCSNHESSSNYINPASGLSDRLVYQDHLQYFLYGAMIYMALKLWERALSFLEIVIATPTVGTGNNGPSMIQVEAYKKWVLVGLLNQGHIPRTPRNINSQAMKAYQSLGKPYIALAEVFKEGIKNEESVNKLLDEARYGQACWKDDFNEGLVKQVIHAFRRFSVQHLEKAYAALTVADIARRTAPDPSNFTDTANYLVQLISMGQLNATISQPSEDSTTWVVRFTGSYGTGPDAQPEEQQYENLKMQTERITNLMDHVREADRQFGFSREYIQEARKARKAKESGQGDTDETMNALSAQHDVFAQDEDIMS